MKTLTVTIDRTGQATVQSPSDLSEDDLQSVAALFLKLLARTTNLQAASARVMMDAMQCPLELLCGD